MFQQAEFEEFVQRTNNAESNSLMSEFNKILENDKQILRQQLHDAEQKLAEVNTNSMAFEQERASSEIERSRLNSEIHQKVNLIVSSFHLEPLVNFGAMSFRK